MEAGAGVHHRHHHRRPPGENASKPHPDKLNTSTNFSSSSKALQRKMQAARRQGVLKMVGTNVGFLDDLFVDALKLAWWKLCVVFLLVLVAESVVFFVVYLLDAEGLEGNSGPYSIFMFSVSLTTTFGGTPVSANSNFALFIGNVHTLVTMLHFVFVTGVVFAKLAQPKPCVEMAKYLILGRHNESAHPCLYTRLVLTNSPPELVDARFTLTYRHQVVLPTGQLFLKLDSLALARAEAPVLMYANTVRHFIDKESPLHGKTMSDLAREHATFVLSAIGMDRFSMETVYADKEYSAVDGAVMTGVEFEDMVLYVPDRPLDRQIDHDKLNDLIVCEQTVSYRPRSRSSSASAFPDADIDIPTQASSPPPLLVQESMSAIASDLLYAARNSDRAHDGSGDHKNGDS